MLPAVIRRAPPRSAAANSNDKMATARLQPASETSADDSGTCVVNAELTSTIWLAEFEPAHAATRLQVYETLAPLCERLVVAFHEVNHITTGARHAVTVRTQASAVCYLAEAEVESIARHRTATALCGLVHEFNLFAAYDWCALVQRHTHQDMLSEVKNVAWTDMDVQYKLWWLITKENVRSDRSTNSRLAMLLVDTPHARTILRSLLDEHRIRANKNNPLRIDYRLCQSVAAADTEIRNVQPWADQVMDWFAERLPEPQLNRSSLYLWGPAGVGKSRLVSRLLAGRMCLRRDCCEGFFLQDLAEEFEFVWLDEFVPAFMTTRGEFRQQFNKLTGRELVVVRAKNASQYEVDASSIRTIICSNEAPPEADYFARRLFAVKARTSLYGTAVHVEIANSSARRKRKHASSESESDS